MTHLSKILQKDLRVRALNLGHSSFFFLCHFQARHLGEPASCFISVAVARPNETVWEDYSYLAGLVGKKSPFYADCLTPRWAALYLRAEPHPPRSAPSV